MAWIGYLSPRSNSDPKSPYESAFIDGVNSAAPARDVEVLYTGDSVAGGTLTADINALVGRTGRCLVGSSTPLADEAQALHGGLIAVALGVTDPTRYSGGTVVFSPNGAGGKANASRNGTIALKHAYPGLARIAIAYNGSIAAKHDEFIDLTTDPAALALGVTFVDVPFTAGNLSTVISGLSSPADMGLVVLSDPLAVRNAGAIRTAWGSGPSTGPGPEFTAAGFAMSYGPDRTNFYRQAGRKVATL